MRKSHLTYASLCLCCCLLFTRTYAQLQKIYLHPKAPGTEKQSQFVDSIRLIPLEIKEGVELGNYNNVVVTDAYFLITDYSGKAVWVYAKNGRFVRKVSFGKLGEGFYPSYNEHSNQLVFFGNNRNYALTPKDEIKIRMDWDNPRNKKYFKKYTIDLADTSFVLRKENPVESDILRSLHFYDDYFWQGQIRTSPLFRDSLDYELKLYQDNRLVKALFPYNRVKETRFLFTEESTVFSKTDTPTVHYVTRPFCDTVYRMVGNSLTPAYQLVLPLENSLPPSFFNKPFKNKTERENFGRNNGWTFHQVYDFYDTPRFVFFTVAYLGNYESYVYLKQSGTTFKTKNVKADSSQYNLSLLNDFGMVKKNGRFYKTQKAGDLLAFLERNKNVAVPKELEAFLKSHPQSTSPLIVEFKLKH